jgi:hypothetical protein
VIAQLALYETQIVDMPLGKPLDRIHQLDKLEIIARNE